MEQGEREKSDSNWEEVFKSSSENEGDAEMRVKKGDILLYDKHEFTCNLYYM